MTEPKYDTLDRKKPRGIKRRQCCNTVHASNEACPHFLRNRYKPLPDGGVEVTKVWAK